MADTEERLAAKRKELKHSRGSRGNNPALIKNVKHANNPQTKANGSV